MDKLTSMKVFIYVVEQGSFRSRKPLQPVGNHDQ